MGYTTDFLGAFVFAVALSEAQRDYINKFSATRRMARNATLAAERPDPVRKAVKLPIGNQGGYFVGAEEYDMDDGAKDILDKNSPPSGQPGLWCKWEVTGDGANLQWNGHEKFHGYVEWLKYLIENFFKPWNKVLNGSVKWAGEEVSDAGTITIKNNIVTTRRR